MRHHSSENGFSLIELSIILVVIGLLALPFIQQYRSYVITSELNVTRSNIDSINASIGRYYERNGFYPCPERNLTLPITDPSFGAIDPNTSATQDCPLNTQVGPNSVVYGHIPVQELDLDASLALDGWGNKITYAVTGRLTNHPLNVVGGPADWQFPHLIFNQTTGAIPVGAITEVYVTEAGSPNAPSIDILNTFGATATAQADAQQHAAFISHGPTGLGAFDANGVPVGACPATGTAHDRENCDNANNIIYSNRSTLEKSDIPGPDFYDDFVLVIDNPGGGGWSYSQVDAEDTYNYYRIVGINVTDPMSGLIDAGGQKRLGMDVGGTIQLEDTIDVAKDGNAHATEVCDETGSLASNGSGNCFNPQIIAGTGINCGGTNTAIRGIANNSPQCFRYIPISSVSCTFGTSGPGTYIKKIYATGESCCGLPSDDPAILCP